MSPALQFSHERETGEVFIANLRDFKHILGTDLHAITFCLAGVVIYHWPIRSGLCPALLSGSVGVLCGPPGFPPDFLWSWLALPKVHAAFLNESPTRGRVQHSVQEIRVAELNRAEPLMTASPGFHR